MRNIENRRACVPNTLTRAIHLFIVILTVILAAVDVYQQFPLFLLDYHVT